MRQKMEKNPLAAISANKSAYCVNANDEENEAIHNVNFPLEHIIAFIWKIGVQRALCVKMRHPTEMCAEIILNT